MGNLKRPAARRRRRDGELRFQSILDAGLEVFSLVGLHGASIDQIAERAGSSKANLLYYFISNDDLYTAVLKQVLEVWLQPLRDLDADSDPATALKTYIRTKLMLSRDEPQASRLFCLEIVRGAPLLHGELEGPLRNLVEAKAEVLRRWMAEGRVAPHDPYHLIFSIWSITQHYADFATQVGAVTGSDLSDPDFFEGAVTHAQSLVLGRLGLS